MGAMTKERQRDVRKGINTVANKPVTSQREWSVGDKVYKPLKIQIINASKLRDAVYQRKIDPANVKNIIDDYRLEMLNPIKVGFRADGSYRIIDGQHTYMVLTQLFGDDIPLTCIIVENTSEDWSHLTDEQVEARIFAHQHDHTRKLTVNERFNASVIGGEKYAVTILKICDNNGFNLCYKDGQTASYNKPVCTSTLIDIYKKDNGVLLDKTLSVLRLAYDGNADSLQNQFVKSIADFIDKYEKHKNYSINKFVSALSKRVEPSELVQKSKLDSDNSKRIYGEKKSVKYCSEMLLLDSYNKCKTKENKILLK